MLYKQFYSELGKLLYAIACADGMIMPAEEKKFRELVKKVLVPSDKHHDEFGTEAAYYTEIEFDFLVNEMADPEASFDSFINYVNEHHTAFTPQMQSMCMSIVENIANTYRGINQKENAMINKLRKELKDLPSFSIINK